MRPNMPNTPPHSIRRYLYKTSPKSRVFRFALPLTALAAALLLFVVSFAPQQASAQQIPAPSGVDAWIDYTSDGLVAMRIDFDFDRTEVDGERIVKVYRIDTRYRADDNVVFSDDPYDKDTNPHGWRRYAGYTNTGEDKDLPCAVNVDNPNNDPDITALNRKCAMVTIWPEHGRPGEYEARIVAEGAGGVEGPAVEIQSKGIEPKPGKARITSVTGTFYDDDDDDKGAFQVRWEHADRAAKYLVQYVLADGGSFDDSTTVTEQVYDHPTHLAGIGPLDQNTDYLVRIIAVGTFGREGDPTEARSVTTGGRGQPPVTTITPQRTQQELVDLYDTNPNDGVISLAEANQAVEDAIQNQNHNPTDVELYRLLDFYFSQRN